MVNAWLSSFKPAAPPAARDAATAPPPAQLQTLENRTLMSGDGLTPQIDSYRDDEYATVFPGATAPATDAVAPFYNVFDATETFLNNGAGSELDRANLVNAQYRWTIDGNPDAQFDNAGRLIQDIQSSVTQAEGLVVGHVFDQAGVYTVTLDVSLTDADGTVRRASTTETIQIDHEIPRGFTADSFAADRLWERDVDGAEYRLIGGSAAEARALAAAAPEGVTIRHYSSGNFSHAFRGNLDNVRIYFNRGETYTFDTRNGLIDLPDADDLYIGTYGDAADAPLLDVANDYNPGGSQGIIRILNGSDRVTIEGLDLEGRGDNNNLSTAQGGDGLPADLRFANNPQGLLSGVVSHDARSVLLRDLDISRVSQHGILTSGEGTDGLALIDSALHDLSRYGAYLGADNAQALARDAVFGNFTVAGNHFYNISGGEHGVRIQGLTPDSPSDDKRFLENVYIADNIIETSPEAPSKTAIQVRGNAQNIVIADNVADRVIGLQPQNRANGAYEQIRRAQVFDNYVGLSRESFPGAAAQYGHGYFAFQIYANDVSVRGNIADDYNIGFDLAGARVGNTPIAGRSLNNVFVHNNALINRDRAGLRDEELTFRDTRLALYQHIDSVSLTDNQSFNLGFTGRGISHTDVIAAQGSTGNAPRLSGNNLGQTLTGIATNANPTQSVTDAAAALRERIYGIGDTAADLPAATPTPRAAAPTTAPAPTPIPTATATPTAPTTAPPTATPTATPAPITPTVPSGPGTTADPYENNNNPGRAFALTGGSLGELAGTAVTDANRGGDYYRLSHSGGDLTLNLDADRPVAVQLFTGTGNTVHQRQALAPQQEDGGTQTWSGLAAGDYTVLVYDRDGGGLPYDLTWGSDVDIDVPAAPNTEAPSPAPAAAPAPAALAPATATATDAYESNDNPASATFLSGRTGSLATASGLATVDANRVGDYYAIEVGDGPLALRLTGDDPAVSDLGLQLFSGVSANLHDSLNLTPDRTGGTNVQRWDNLEAGLYTVLVYGQQDDAGLQYNLEWSQA